MAALPGIVLPTTSTGVPPPPSARPPYPAARRSAPSIRQLGLAGLSLLWFAVADALSGRAARGLTNRFDHDNLRPLLTALFLVFLLTVGFALFEAFAGEGFGLRRASGLPRRRTAGREWGLGAAIGWGLAIACVLPLAFGRSFHVRFWTEPQALPVLAIDLATLLATALATEMALRGYPFRRLVAALGAGWATALAATVLGTVQWFTPNTTAISVAVTMLFAVLLSLAWLRTHGLWLGWGLRAAWSIGVAILFGLPLRGVGNFASVVQTRAIRPMWLTGDGFGPEGAVLTVFALLFAIAVLVRTTDDYAWEYTRPDIVAAGYVVEPPSPAAHVAMTGEVESRPAALVQILPSTPHSRSVEGP